MIADDHPVVRAGYRRLLEETTTRFQVIAEAGSGRECLAKFGAFRPDIVMLDLSMPQGEGFETLRRLLSHDPFARVVVFTMHESAVVMRRVLSAGAKGFVTKSCSATDVIKALLRVMAGKRYVDPCFLSDSKTIAPKKDRDVIEILSPREFQIFMMLARGRTVREIAQDLCISPKTAGVHQTRILRKTGARNLAELVNLAAALGALRP